MSTGTRWRWMALKNSSDSVIVGVQKLCWSGLRSIQKLRRCANRPPSVCTPSSDQSAMMICAAPMFWICAVSALPFVPATGTPTLVMNARRLRPRSTTRELFRNASPTMYGMMRRGFAPEGTSQ